MFNPELPKLPDNFAQLPRLERRKITDYLKYHYPEWRKPWVPPFNYYKPCYVDVLIVADGNLNFGQGGFGLSEFLTTFDLMQKNSLLNTAYRLTLAHRGGQSSLGIDPANPGNSLVVKVIFDFQFDTTPLIGFEQIWIFGIDSFNLIGADEVTAIETYMNKGGGVFATGDHGSLGCAMSNAIPRIKDMRLWASTSGNNDLDEVSMDGIRRNDTNRPSTDAASHRFDNQSDQLPQIILPRLSGGSPHYLLSINTTLRPSGIIDILPDHPHEGQCTPERDFTVVHPTTGVSTVIRSQVIAENVVTGGNTTLFRSKPETVGHTFPSISVFDGRVGGVGRIVVDATWHHFVNINLNGSDSGLDGPVLSGLNDNDFRVVQQYYMNISHWISRRKLWICWYKWIVIKLIYKTQLIEASLNKPHLKLEELPLDDLRSIGLLAKEIIGNHFTPVIAEEFMRESIEEILPDLSNNLNKWNAVKTKDKAESFNDFDESWIQHDNLLGTAVGAGLMAVRDKFGLYAEKLTEKNIEGSVEIFNSGVKLGASKAIDSFNKSMNQMINSQYNLK